jgi:transcriptional regulator with XRE-family HTH domain
MEKHYTEENSNVYFKARKEAAIYNDKLYSRESASELLGLSVSSLANYELGTTKVVPVDVVLMADLYKCPELKAMYCKNECPIGKDLPIEVSYGTVESIVIKLLKELKQDEMQAVLDDLVEIAADGRVTQTERFRLEQVIDRFNKLSLVISELRLLGEKEL